MEYPSRISWTELTNGGNIEDGSDHRHEQDGAQVVEEQSIGHKVTGVQDNRRQHIEEECVRGQGGYGDIGAEI